MFYIFRNCTNKILCPVCAVDSLGSHSCGFLDAPKDFLGRIVKCA